MYPPIESRSTGTNSIGDYFTSYGDDDIYLQIPSVYMVSQGQKLNIFLPGILKLVNRTRLTLLKRPWGEISGCLIQLYNVIKIPGKRGI